MPQQPGSDNGIGYQPAIGPVSRAIRRHWWKIGLTWGVFATGLILSTYFSIDLSFHSRRFVVGSTILAAAMGAVVGLFAWLDARSGLVGDPRRFARRSGLHLLGVIAPLPEIRAGESEDDERAERSLAVFVHTLDELLLDLRFGRRP